MKHTLAPPDSKSVPAANAYWFMAEIFKEIVASVIQRQDCRLNDLFE